MSRAPRIVVYRARDGWRWRMHAGNGRIVADGGEAYVRKGGAEKAAHRLIQLACSGRVIVEVAK